MLLVLLRSVVRLGGWWPYVEPQTQDGLRLLPKSRLVHAVTSSMARLRIPNCDAP